MAFFLTAAGAALAVALELLEALAIVLAVGLVRRPRDAVVGALAATVVLAALALIAGPLALAALPEDVLELVIGVLLLLFGLEWLRKGVLRLSGRRSRSSAYREFIEEQDALEALPPPAPGRGDWAGRAIAFKGVFLEGVEVILIVSALGARPGGLTPALVGAGAALVLVVATGVALRSPLSRIPETHLKFTVGLVLSAFGVFLAAEGLGVEWPLGDAALLYVGAALAGVALAQVAMLARASRISAG